MLTIAYDRAISPSRATASSPVSPRCRRCAPSRGRGRSSGVLPARRRGAGPQGYASARSSPGRYRSRRPYRSAREPASRRPRSRWISPARRSTASCRAGPSGRPSPAKLALTLIEGPLEIRDLQLDAGPVQIRGSAWLTIRGHGREGGPCDIQAVGRRRHAACRSSARTASTRSPFAATSATRGPSSVPERARRRLLLALKEAKADAKDIDLDVALNILTGHNDEAVTNAALKASLRRDNLRQLDLEGRLGSPMSSGRPFRGRVARSSCASGGCRRLLRFLDVYRRMRAATWSSSLRPGEGPQVGFVTFTASRCATSRRSGASSRRRPGSSPGPTSSGRPQSVRIDVNEVGFTQARVDFVRTAGRLDFKDRRSGDNRSASR